MAERIEELEVKLAYLEATLTDLDEIVREFADRVVALEREVRLLRQSADQDALSTTTPEKPPHY